VSNLSRVFSKIRKLIQLWLSKDHLGSREDFVKYATQLATIKGKSPRILEIGPYMSPLVSGQKVDTFDVLTKEELVSRANSEGGPSYLIPDVTWVGPEASNLYIRAKYDLILSSHVVEHQIDLIAHFQNIDSLLLPEGHYAALIPDHRYCFDHFNLPSTIIDVLLAHIVKNGNHSLKNFLEDRLTTGHNETNRYWKKDFGSPKIIGKSFSDVLDLVAEYRKTVSNEIYVDVHAWKFTDRTFIQIFSMLKEMGLISLEVVKIEPVKRGNNEFWILFRK
jgi:SAM-dependent methyltransferase